MTTPTTFFPRTILLLNTSPQQIWTANSGARPLITVPFNTGGFIVYIGPKTALLKQDYASCLAFQGGNAESFDDVEIWAISTAPGGVAITVTPNGEDYQSESITEVTSIPTSFDQLVNGT